MFPYFPTKPQNSWFPRNRESWKVIREIPFGNRVKSRSQFLSWLEVVTGSELGQNLLEFLNFLDSHFLSNFFKKLHFTGRQSLQVRIPWPSENHIFEEFWRQTFFLSRRQYPNRRELIWIAKRTQKYQKCWLLHHFPIGKSRSPYVPIFSYKTPEFLIPAEQRKLKGHQRNTLWKPSQISIAIFKLTWSCHRLRVGSEPFGISELFGQSFLVQLFKKLHCTWRQSL